MTSAPHSSSTPDRIGRWGGRILRNRRLMRAPIHLYRAGLGFVFGSRMLMLEHIGRTSGRRRHVVLEVVGHPDRDTYVVVSGFGQRSQWFRNIEADPHVRVSVALRRSVPATARILPQPEADEALQAYVQRHPRAWSKFKPVVEDTLGTSISEHQTELPMVGLHLEPSGQRCTGEEGE